jgi:hypothetical protein
MLFNFSFVGSYLRRRYIFTKKQNARASPEASGDDLETYSAIELKKDFVDNYEFEDSQHSFEAETKCFEHSRQSKDVRVGYEQVQRIEATLFKLKGGMFKPVVR